MSCGAQVYISGIAHLVFRCTRDKGHEGPHAISLGSSLLRKLKAAS